MKDLINMPKAKINITQKPTKWKKNNDLKLKLLNTLTQLGSITYSASLLSWFPKIEFT